MKPVFKFIMLAAAVTLTFSECKKKKEEPAPAEEPAPNPTPTGINTIADVFSSQGAPTQTFDINTAVANTIVANGVKIEIPANMFLTSTGGNTITGNATVSVKTIVDKQAVMLSGAGANSSGSKLVSTKGCVKITASQNSQSLRLVPTTQGTLVVGVPDGTVAPAPMKKYYANKISADDSTKVWALGTDIANIPSSFDVQTNKFMHKAALDSLKWLNVGVQFDSTATKVAVTANVGSQFNKTNTAVYLSLNGSLTVGALFEISANTFRISNIPQGKGAHLVAIAVINGQYYWASQSLLASSTPVNLNLTATTIDNIKTAINALP